MGHGGGVVGGFHGEVEDEGRFDVREEEGDLNKHVAVEAPLRAQQGMSREYAPLAELIAWFV